MTKVPHKLIWGVALVEAVAVVATATYLVRREAPTSMRCATAPVMRAQQREVEDPIVCVTRGNRYYHRRSCRYVRSSRLPVRLSQGKVRWRPCSRCKPAW